MSRVLDASVVVAALVDGGEDGRWAEGMLLGDHLTAPHHLPSEVANILRRATHGGQISRDASALAHIELQTLPIDYFPYAPFASRIWELRDTVTPYDAWYVALAETLDAELATLDRRLVRAPGPRCGFLTR
jgi:predicted nucleic acid-binding protein